MSIIHPQAKQYRSIRTDNDNKFDSFIEWAQTNSPVDNPVDNPVDSPDDNYVIQLVYHPNFGACNKTIKFFKKELNIFVEVNDIDGYKRANSYKNIKTNRNEGHDKGMFYELNLYTKSTNYSNHHTSRVNGSNYLRDSTHDKESVETKGTHWKD